MNPSLWKCPKRVGFLFPHPCERLTPIGCPDCQNGAVTDPYRDRDDRHGYSGRDFDSYSSTETKGIEISDQPVFGGGDSGGGGASMDFTEADGDSLTDADRDFEDDLSAS